jgi:hypothetical protein
MLWNTLFQALKNIEYNESNGWQLQEVDVLVLRQNVSVHKQQKKYQDETS